MNSKPVDALAVVAEDLKAAAAHYQSWRSDGAEHSRNYSWFVILNEVKNPFGQRQHSQRNPTGFFATLRMTWGSENGDSIFETALGANTQAELITILSKYCAPEFVIRLVVDSF